MPTLTGRLQRIVAPMAQLPPDEQDILARQIEADFEEARPFVAGMFRDIFVQVANVTVR
jgi:hypothetical protein